MLRDSIRCWTIEGLDSPSGTRYASSMHDAECDEIDAFIASYKTLDGIMPDWADHRGRDFQVRWGIRDANDIEYSELCITSDRRAEYISFTAIYRQKMFYRMDLVPPLEQHHNPFGAAALGLPNFVMGAHVHGWSESREYVRINGFGTLPYRRQIPGVVETIADGLAWVAEDLNITATPEQRVCHLPDRGLF